MKIFDARSGRISYFFRKGGWPTLLFIHGNSASSHFWKNQVSDSALQHFTMILPDLPGHGASEFIDGGYSLTGWAASIGELLDSLSIRDVILIGHSLGGHIAIRIAADRADVIGMLLLGTTPLTSSADISQAFCPSDVLACIFEERIPGDLTPIEAAFFTQPEPAFEVAYRRTDPVVRSSVAGAASSIDFPNEIEIINGLPYPVAIAVGEGDLLVNQDYLRGIVSNNFFQHRLQTVQESRHYSQWDNPSGFNTFLLQYMEAICLRNHL